MSDMFLQNDARSLLDGKHILLIGDSNMRSLYKDIVCLLARGSLLNQKENQSKGLPSFLGDRRKRFSAVTKSREYVEDREYLHARNNIKVEFSFTTRVYTEAIKKKLGRMSKPPDVVLYNSTFWDLSRWGPNGDKYFRHYLVKLMKCLEKNLPPSTLVIWLTAIHPSSKLVHSGLIVKQIDFIKRHFQFNVLEANRYAAEVVQSYGFDVLDVHYYTKLLCHRRRPDGVHFSTLVMRYITNLALTHIALAWEMPLPGRVDCKDIRRIQEAIETDGVKLKRSEPEPTCKEATNMDVKDDHTRQFEPARKIIHAKRKVSTAEVTMNELQVTSARKILRKNLADAWNAEFELDNIFKSRDLVPRSG
ncbi:hypothetical protein WDU94_004468 [Cyamophila willieti]